jgi:hypothetical protein
MYVVEVQHETPTKTDKNLGTEKKETVLVCSLASATCLLPDLSWIFPTNWIHMSHSHSF